MGTPPEIPKPLFHLGRDVGGCSTASPEGLVLCPPKSLAPGERWGKGLHVDGPLAFFLADLVGLFAWCETAQNICQVGQNLSLKRFRWARRKNLSPILLFFKMLCALKSWERNKELVLVEGGNDFSEQVEAGEVSQLPNPKFLTAGAA